MSFPSTIALDGTAGSGKSTVGKRLAERLGYLLFDTGVLYRAVAWAACDREVPIDDQRAIEGLVAALQIDVRPPGLDCEDERPATVFVDGRDVTWDIRKPEIDQCVSPVSAYPGVRQALLGEQRAIGARGQVVMVGRDIGTVVLPDADAKLFVDAAVEERARRRHAEAIRRGLPGTYEDVLADMRERDTRDREKPISPMVPADDAIIVDTTTMSQEEVVDWIVAVLDEKAAGGGAGR